MPLYVISNELEFDAVILERRLNVMVFTVCWSIGSKMLLPAILDLSYDPNLIHVNFLRIDMDNTNLSLTQRLIITTVPTIQWYFHGNKLDELIGVDLEQLTAKTHRLATIYKRKTTTEAVKQLTIDRSDEGIYKNNLLE